MRVHHLNCGSMCPTGLASSLRIPSMVCHCLLIETPTGLVLVDTGFGLHDCDISSRRLGMSSKLIGAALLREEAAIEQVRRLGFQPEDVRDIVVTHLDFDHAGGISDFPDATVHVMQDEYEAARSFEINLMHYQRYKKTQWQDHKKWKFHKEEGESWLGFDAIKTLGESQADILLIPLRGHTKGHAGIAVNTGREWLLHVGDCYYSHVSAQAENFRVPKALELLESSFAVDNDLRLKNVERLRSLNKEYRSSVNLFCAHDIYDFKKF